MSIFSGHVEGRWVGDRAISRSFSRVFGPGGGGGVAVCLLSPKSIFEFTLLLAHV